MQNPARVALTKQSGASAASLGIAYSGQYQESLLALDELVYRAYPQVENPSTTTTIGTRSAWCAFAESIVRAYRKEALIE